MATALGYQCRVSVEKIFRDSQCFLVLTMSVSDCLSVSDCPPSNCAGEVSPLEPPVATLDAHQPPSTMAEIPLFPSTTGKPKWQATWTTPISSVWLPPQFTVNFWRCSGAKWNDAFKIAVWEVTFCGTPTVSRQMSSCSD